MVTVYNMNGRYVCMVSISMEQIFEHHKCNDCGGEPRFLVVEMDELSKEFDPKANPSYAKSWIWCGICDIGQ